LQTLMPDAKQPSGKRIWINRNQAGKAFKPRAW